MENTQFFMNEAFKLAEKALEINEVPIGCVIVYNNEIIAKGYNMRNTNKNTLDHAEIIAINEACEVLNDWRLEGCTMYVTVEPCPMCAGAIVQSRMDKVVYGTKNLKAGFCGSVLNILQMEQLNHKVEIESGVLEDKCKEIMQLFFRNFRLNKKS